MIAACGGGDDPDPTVAADTGTQRLDPTPACGDNGATPEQTEGPFFTPDSPERTSLLEPGVAGAVLLLRGRVLTTQLYFPGEPANESDGIFDPLLLVDLGPERNGETPARFDFVLQRA